MDKDEDKDKDKSTTIPASRLTIAINRIRDSARQSPNVTDSGIRLIQGITSICRQYKDQPAVIEALCVEVDSRIQELAGVLVDNTQHEHEFPMVTEEGSKEPPDDTPIPSTPTGIDTSDDSTYHQDEFLDPMPTTEEEFEEVRRQEESIEPVGPARKGRSR